MPASQVSTLRLLQLFNTKMVESCSFAFVSQNRGQSKIACAAQKWSMGSKLLHAADSPSASSSASPSTSSASSSVSSLGALAGSPLALAFWERVVLTVSQQKLLAFPYLFDHLQVHSVIAPPVTWLGNQSAVWAASNPDAEATNMVAKPRE